MSETLSLKFLSLDLAQPYKVPAKDRVIVGKTNECDLNLLEYFAQKSLASISRKHFEIRYHNEHFMIVDQSLNGTFVNNRRLLKGKMQVLYNGDVIQLPGDEALSIAVEIEGLTEPLALIDPTHQHLLDQIEAQRDIILLGLPGAGKTTMLRSFLPPLAVEQTAAYTLPQYRNFLFCYVNCMAIDTANPSPASFFKLLIAATKPLFEAWPSEIRENYQNLSNDDCALSDVEIAILDTINRVYQHHAKPLVFLLDQFDDIYYQLPPALFSVLKSLKLVQPPPLFIIATRNELQIINEHIDQFFRTLFNRYEYWLPQLDDEQLETVIAPYNLSPTQLAICLRLGNRQPRLSSLIAKRLNDTHFIIPDSKNKLIEKLNQDIEIAHHNQAIWQSLLADEQAALKSVARGKPRMMQPTEERLTTKKFLLIGEGADLAFNSALYQHYVESLLETSSTPIEISPEVGLSFDESRSQFVLEGHPLPIESLAPLDRGLLFYLFNNYGRVCSYLQIWENVWGYPDDQIFDKGTIARVISSIRRRLDEISAGAADRYIHTVRGQGYKLTKTGN